MNFTQRESPPSSKENPYKHKVNLHFDYPIPSMTKTNSTRRKYINYRNANRTRLFSHSTRAFTNTPDRRDLTLCPSPSPRILRKDFLNANMQAGARARRGPAIFCLKIYMLLNSLGGWNEENKKLINIYKFAHAAIASRAVPRFSLMCEGFDWLKFRLYSTPVCAIYMILQSLAGILYFNHCN